MRAVLVWKDGREELTPDAGALRIHRPWRHPDGRSMETVFHAGDYVKATDTFQYVEGETEDVTDAMIEAGRRNRERTASMVSRGLNCDGRHDQYEALERAVRAFWPTVEQKAGGRIGRLIADVQRALDALRSET